MQGNAEEAVPSQVPLSTKRTRTRTKVTRGMVKEWDMMAGKGMPHREIATMYGVSLVTGPSSGGCQQKAGRQNHEVSGLSDSSDGRCGN